MWSSPPGRRSRSTSRSTPAATSGSPTRTSSGANTPRTPDASAIKTFGLAGKIFLASALLVVAVLGGTLRVAAIHANRTAHETIRPPPPHPPRPAADLLAGPPHPPA